MDVHEGPKKTPSKKTTSSHRPSTGISGTAVAVSARVGIFIRKFAPSPPWGSRQEGHASSNSYRLDRANASRLAGLRMLVAWHRGTPSRRIGFPQSPGFLNQTRSSAPMSDGHTAAIIATRAVAVGASATGEIASHEGDRNSFVVYLVPRSDVSVRISGQSHRPRNAGGTSIPCTNRRPSRCATPIGDVCRPTTGTAAGSILVRVWSGRPGRHLDRCSRLATNRHRYQMQVAPMMLRRRRDVFCRHCTQTEPNQ